MTLRQITPHETIGRIDALDWQEHHSPTIATTVTTLSVNKRPIVDRVRRRGTDARLWDAMSPLQQTAAEKIATGFRIITSGVSVKCQVFEKTYGRGNPDKAEQTMKDYNEWVHRCRDEGIDVNMVIETIVIGNSCSTADSVFKKRKGTARENLFAALSTYVDMKKWAK